MSLTRVDLPEPDTPVIAVKVPSGIFTFIPFRVCARGVWMVTNLPFDLRRTGGGSMRSTPARKRPVSDSGFAITSSGVPTATTCPPSSPAPGPRSTT